MPVYTPRGLKIRFPPDVAFGLMARLYPRVDAATILRTTEAIELTPAAMTFLAGLVTFLFRLDPYAIFVASFSTYVLTKILTLLGIVSDPGTVGESVGRFIRSAMLVLAGYVASPGYIGLGLVHSYISGYGVLLLTLLGIGYLMVGWVGIVAYLGGRVLGALIGYALEFGVAKRYMTLVGVPFTAAETNFINAYRIHAERLGESISVSISDSDREESHWRAAFEDYAAKHPAAALRSLSGSG